MEKNVLALLIALFAAIAACSAQKDIEYIFVCPRSLNIGADNEVSLLQFGVPQKGNIKFQVYYSDSFTGNETLAYEYESTKIDVATTLLNFHLDPPIIDYVYSGRIQLNGTIGGTEIGGSEQVTFSTPNQQIIIIQTDKPLYKPGENVNWRVLKVDADLKPSLNKDDVAVVYVADAIGTRLFQFENVTLDKGLYGSQFPLANEPVLGFWSITLMTNTNATTSAYFNVMEYVLPKFDINIKFPSFVLATEEIIPIQVCANYTYGKGVQGQLNLTIYLNTYYYYYDYYPYSSYLKNPVLVELVELNGCYTYNLNVSLIQTSSSDYNSGIVVFADVQENGTGVEINDTQYLYRTTYPLNLDFNFNQQQRPYFKSGLPYNGQLKVTNPDSTPAANQYIELSYTVSKQRVIANYLGNNQVKYSKNFTTDANGIIEYTIPPQNEDTLSITLEARSINYTYDPNNPNQILSQPQTSFSLSPFFSPSGSSIQLVNVDRPLQCGSKTNVTLLFTSKQDANFKFFYQVVHQGKELVQGTYETSFKIKDDVSAKYENKLQQIDAKEETLVPPPELVSNSSSNPEKDCPAAAESKYVPPIGELNISLEVQFSYSPSFRLLIFYIRDDKEVVADSMLFQVEKCFNNTVGFQFSDAVKQPGQTTQVQITASKNSLCGIKTIDKSVTLLDNSDQLTADTVFQQIQSMDTGIYYETNTCGTTQPGLSKGTAIFPPIPPIGSYSSYQDSYTSFQNAGYLVISNLKLITRPCTTSANVILPRPYHIAVEYAYRGFSGKQAEESFDVAGDGGGAYSTSAPIITTQSAVDVRQNFPETWLFEMELVGPSGVYTKNETLPDTLTEWLGSAVCVSPDAGLGISNTTSIIGFQLFFISYTLPVSVIRGEEFTVVVSIFSYADAALPVTVSVDKPEGYEITDNSVNGDICIQPGTSVSPKLKLKATTIGNINITVRAETSKNTKVCGNSKVSSSVAKDAIKQSLQVEAEGFPVETVQGILFCPQDEKNKKYNVTYRLDVPDKIVEGSDRAFVDVTGNILGKSIENLDYLVSIPTGCGEQNLVKFVPNYVVLDYLTSIGELTDSIKARAIRNLVTGYQQELNYRRSDGSFSAFGQVDQSGSMFLTAFVVRSFVQAQKYISIDETVVTNAQNWIVDNQQEDGCFPNVGKIIDSGIQGGLEKDKSLTAITAYVLASLLISKYPNQSVIDLATTCLKNHKPTTPYETFLVAYAYALAGDDSDAKKELTDIKPFSRTTDGVESYTNPNGTLALDIETNSYAVLANLALDNSAKDVLPIVRYLSQNIQATGGFYSTQDTCVGLTALSEFAKLVYKDPINIDVSIKGGLIKQFHIDDDNKILVQRNQVTEVPSQLDIEATGTGCGLIQATLRYNSNTPPGQNKFYIKLVGECEGENTKKRKIIGIVSYSPPGKAAGFSLVQVKMPTGVVPDADSIRQLPANSNYKILRADVETNTVNLYYNEISNNEEHFEFEVEEEIEVVNRQPGSGKVFEYYAPENSATTTYTFDCSK